jgi:hypothetical protein
MWDYSQLARRLPNSYETVSRAVVSQAAQKLDSMDVLELVAAPTSGFEAVPVLEAGGIVAGVDFSAP